jgi:flagellar secretion chaperone FliS
MQLAQFAKSYKAAAVNTASRGQLVLMLYDGALRFMGIALEGFNDGEIVRRNQTIHNNLVKTQNILLQLQGTLDMQAGGEFSSRMHALYEFMQGQLKEANLRKEAEPIRTVERLLGGIRDAWAKMLQQSATQNPAA